MKKSPVNLLFSLALCLSLNSYADEINLSCQVTGESDGKPIGPTSIEVNIQQVKGMHRIFVQGPEPLSGGVVPSEKWGNQVDWGGGQDLSNNNRFLVSDFRGEKTTNGHFLFQNNIEISRISGQINATFSYEDKDTHLKSVTTFSGNCEKLKNKTKF